MDDKKAKRIVTLVFLVMPLAFFLFSGGFFLLNRSTYNSIQESHTTVEATVSKVTKSKGSDTLVVNYTVDGKDYTTAIMAQSGKLKEGDTVELLCSTKAPAAATTEESYSYTVKTDKTRLLIAGIAFAIFLIIWIILVPVADRIEKKNRRGNYYMVRNNDYSISQYMNEKSETRTPYGTIKRNPNYRKK